jgi:predicted helicase
MPKIHRRTACKQGGNPPYNANQQNENENANNKNRAYPHIDGLIKQSFDELGTAQKTKVYDMYALIFRWAFGPELSLASIASQNPFNYGF